MTHYPLLLLHVHHRVDGLEIESRYKTQSTIVHHRVDGLEIRLYSKREAIRVHHRVDGLESC